ncbi:hypothetical protein AC578_8209 [Pseudocercospora eumusae]|uniref:Uncharacterized protein n=1 Tax=Pseudocercospora eumusae TaxID=321146 RepID=A0A139HEX0_9PEZI|nr:hypothetical protein AC578_8209 [Pseudocercospora eumusae]
MGQKQALGYFNWRSSRGILANMKAVDACKSTPGRLLEMTIDEGRKPLKEGVIDGVVSVVNNVAVPLGKNEEHDLPSN